MPTWFCSREVFDRLVHVSHYTSLVICLCTYLMLSRVGGFDESGKGTPEDLIFFYRHLDLKGGIHRVDHVLLVYRYHPLQTTFSIDESVILTKKNLQLCYKRSFFFLLIRKVIWDLRLRRLEKIFLEKWSTFTIWNAGKQGRRLFRSLEEQYRSRVVSFCDVDTKKIQQGVYIYEDSKLRPKPRVPIIHFTNAKPPFVICVKLVNFPFQSIVEKLIYLHFLLQDLTKGEFETNLKSLSLVENVDYVMFS